MLRRNCLVRIRQLPEQGNEPALLTTTPAERLAMLWHLALDGWAFKGEPVAESRLPRHGVRTQRRDGVQVETARRTHWLEGQASTHKEGRL
jgi:hypothetical protein